MQALNKTKALLVDEGATFEKAFVTTPVCCPSRASILTGLYLHNTGTYNNSVSGNCSSQNWRDGPEKRAFVTYLKQKVNCDVHFVCGHLNTMKMRSYAT